MTQTTLFSLCWQRRFTDLAKHISLWSKDHSTKVGAVIVRADKSIASTGYNGFPRGTPDSLEELPKAVKYARTVHAEANALLRLNSVETQQLSLFTTHFPCTACAPLIVQRGITAVYFPTEDPDSASYYSRWSDSIKESEALFQLGGVEVIEVAKYG